MFRYLYKKTYYDVFRTLGIVATITLTTNYMIGYYNRKLLYKRIRKKNEEENLKKKLEKINFYKINGFQFENKAEKYTFFFVIDFSNLENFENVK